MLFSRELEKSTHIFSAILNHEGQSFKPQDITSAVYTVIVACCSAIDITINSSRVRQQVFEWLCAALMQAVMKAEPQRADWSLNIDLKGKLPTDFIFDLG